MERYQEALEEAVAAIAALEAGGDARRADDALADLRLAWAALGPEAREQALPEARRLADQLAALKRQAPASPDPAEQVPLRYYDGPLDPDALLEHFGYASFRPGQREAVEAALAGRDSLVVMPTGGGKTLCYQLPGVATDKLTVVVSPLVALIDDQYQRLRSSGHPAVMLAGERDNAPALQAIRDGSARVVFASPERFASRSFVDCVSSRELALFVVDEAHCLAEWGHDFRPDYLRLAKVIDDLGRPPVLAATATATQQVAEEITRRLGLKEPLTVQAGFDRPNLSFDVISLGGKGSIARKRQLLVSGLKLKENRPAIVYCGTRKDVEEVARLLSEEGLEARAYHAGIQMADRQEAQTAFMRGSAEVIVATNAFGMGVDKADVRSVWHWALPTSLEAYYQEAGRAGRDGQPSRAVLLSMRADLGRLIQFNRNRSTTVEHVEAVVNRLRREEQDGYTGLELPLDDDTRLALSIAERSGALALEPGGGGTVVVKWLGPLDRRAANQACQVAKERGWLAYRAIEAFSADESTCRRRLLLDHFGDATPAAPSGRCCSVCDPIDWLPALAEPLPAAAGGAKKGRPKRSADGRTQPLTAAELEGPLAEQLKAWRLARAQGKPAYTVCQNATLAAIIEVKPRSKGELLEIHGIGQGFIEKHADSLLELLATA